MDQATREALIAQYEAGYDRVVKALEQITEAELDARPTPDSWTAREIVHHLADSEMTSAIRIRRLLVEDAPLIQGYDQDAFVGVLWSDRPIDASLEAFGAARRSTVPILRRMTDSDWGRAGIHSESGRYSTEDWLEVYGVHAHDHANQIEEARAFAASVRATDG